jgi:Immunoglobulin-like domain of bacterial spore germination/Sporulation and spore germination
MTKKLLVLALVAAVAVIAWLVLRGRSHTPALATTTAPATMPVKAYFYLGGALVPVVVYVPKTEAVASAATRALLAGPPSGYRTALPAGARLVDLTIAGGTARAGFSRGLAHATRTEQAQIVDTLTQFASVKGVVIDAGGSPVPLSNGAEDAVSGPATSADYGDLTSEAQIFVAKPLRDSTVTSPVSVSGTASVYEATFALEVWSRGKLLKTDSVTATIGAPQRGTFEDTLNLAPGRYKLVLYEPSAENGSHLHTTTVDITVTS